LEGVYLATGHEGLGITTSLATAELIAAHVPHRTPPIPAEAYLPGRLAKETPHA
jgi:glycine/D-amino acid oxidase-like deaminating enzyme